MVNKEYLECSSNSPYIDNVYSRFFSELLVTSLRPTSINRKNLSSRPMIIGMGKF